MRSQSPCAVCCYGLCQHPECWRSSLQQVRDAVWRRNGVKSHITNDTTVDDTMHLRRESKMDQSGGGLPTLKIVDMFSDLDGNVKTNSNRHLAPLQQRVHKRSSSLSFAPSGVSPDSLVSPPGSPRQSPAGTSPPLTEYQRRMKWKTQFPHENINNRGSNCATLSKIGVHELYDENELEQEWQEVYVTSAYLVWCPSNKKKRQKGKRNTSKSSSAQSRISHSKKVILKDVTEDLVPASMETAKQPRPKSTKTPTGGQPFSPHKALPNPNLAQYGMEDLSDLPKPVLSGILKRINWRSNEGSPTEEQPQNTNDVDNYEGNISMTAPQTSSKVLLAVDINSRFTTPEDDEKIEHQENIDNCKEIIDTDIEKPTTVVKTDNEVKSGRELLSMHSIGLPVDDLPEFKQHHCTNSIPKKVTLGVALEPVNLVPITPSPTVTPSDSSHVQQEVKKPHETSLVVNVPSGRPESAPMASSLDYAAFEDRYYVNSAFRYTPSPVRAPATTPISPDKYSEFARYSRSSRHRSWSQDESKVMRRWNTLDSVYGTDDVCKERFAPVGEDVVLADKVFVNEGGVFLTEGITEQMVRIAAPTPRCRSPSPGSRTCIPKDIVEEFHGDIYGRRAQTKESKDKSSHKEMTHTGIVAPGWRQPRSRTPIQLSETPARYPPRPLRQPPPESIPKSLKIVSIPKPEQLRRRPRSTPPRTNSIGDNESVPLVLSDSSLVNQTINSTISMEVRGPSSNISDPGAIPPPPSPEATLKNDPTLETLCEEDERSSIATSIADVLEKNAPLSRLSPLGGGSEMSEESIDVPIEPGWNDSHDHDEGEEGGSKIKPSDSQSLNAPLETHPKQEGQDPECNHKQGPSEEEGTALHLKQQGQEPECNHKQGLSVEEGTALHLKQEHSEGQDTELSHKQGSSVEEVSEPHPTQGFSESQNPELSHKQRSSEELVEEPHSKQEVSKEQITGQEPSEVQDTEPRQKQGCSEEDGAEQHPELTIGDDHKDGCPNSRQQSPDEESLDNDTELLELRDSFQHTQQPPGSPDDVTSNQDFTEGLDMELDLAAELKAAMEGLEGFSLEDEDNVDDENEFEN